VLSGDLVDQFRDEVENIPMGLPLIALQRARVYETQGKIQETFFFYLFTQILFVDVLIFLTF
jgi:hypothetical protein